MDVTNCKIFAENLKGIKKVVFLVQVVDDPGGKECCFTVPHK
jgi:hypothetical protein